MRRVGWSLILTLLVLVGCQQPTETDWPKLDPTVPAPDFTLQQLDGEKVRLADHKGRVVLMEFWATWCQPCRFSTPSMDVIYRQFRDQGVSVFLVNQQEQDDTVRDWVAGRFDATILMDYDGRVGRLYGLRGVPRLLVIDQDGQIRYIKSGYRGGLEHNLKLILQELLKEPLGQGDA